jgi:hypothetical protein
MSFSFTLEKKDCEARSGINIYTITSGFIPESATRGQRIAQRGLSRRFVLLGYFEKRGYPGGRSPHCQSFWYFPFINS